MGYVKYSPEQLAERERAKVAIAAAKAHLKSIREAKKAKKESVATLRRELKAEIKRRKEAASAAKKAERELKALKKKCRPVLIVLRKVYKPYLVARRKVERLKKAKAKAALLADRKAAKEAAQAAKELLKMIAAEEYLAKRDETRTEEKPKSPKKQFKTTDESDYATNSDATIDELNAAAGAVVCDLPPPPKKALKIKKRPSPIQTELTAVVDTINTSV